MTALQDLQELNKLIDQHPRRDLRPDGLSELPIVQQYLLEALKKYAQSKEVSNGSPAHLDG